VEVHKQYLVYPAYPLALVEVIFLVVEEVEELMTLQQELEETHIMVEEVELVMQLLQQILHQVEHLSGVVVEVHLKHLVQ
jgi:hypothetical protein